jgi:hypothetical protein
VSAQKNDKGLWEGRVDLGTDPDGRRVRKRVKAKTKEELARKMRALQDARDGGRPAPDGSTTTAAWLARWGTEVLPGTVADKSAESYRWVLSRYVTPHIGRVPLAKLGPEHVNQMMRALEQKGLSPRTRTYARGVLRRALRQALEWGLVTRNAASLVQAPRRSGTRLDDRLERAQVGKVLAAAKGDRLEALAVLVLATGAAPRRGAGAALAGHRPRRWNALRRGGEDRRRRPHDRPAADRRGGAPPAPEAPARRAHGRPGVGRPRGGVRLHARHAARSPLRAALVARPYHPGRASAGGTSTPPATRRPR